jgi:protein-histidine N-methyltransferase
MKNRETAIENFVAWASDAQFDGVKISEFPGYDLGLEAAKDFKEGELFMVIPKKMIFSFDQPCFEAVVKNIPNIQSMSSMGLAIILLFEKLKPNSYWKPYLDILPEKYSTVLYYSMDEMKELKNSSALLAALKQCKIIARQYVYLFKHIQEKVAAGDESEFISVLKDRFTYDLYW